MSKKFNAVTFAPFELEYLWLDIGELTSEEINNLYWAIKMGKSNLYVIDNIIFETMGRKRLKIHDLYDMLPKYYNGSSECDIECHDMKHKIQVLFLKADMLYSFSSMKLGTLLRKYSKEIGYSFYYMMA